MPEEPSPEEQSLVAKTNIAQVKTLAMKKGLARQKNLISARKKDVIAKQIQPPKELMLFLHDQATFDEILRVAHANIHDTLVRRYYTYVCLQHPAS